jgi:hypothetical protein
MDTTTTDGRNWGRLARRLVRWPRAAEVAARRAVTPDPAAKLALEETFDAWPDVVRLCDDLRAACDELERLGVEVGAHRARIDAIPGLVQVTP